MASMGGLVIGLQQVRKSPTGAEDPSRVAFLLLRAPGENGKPRYLLQLRNDGTWGLPGGKCHQGELPWAGAVREASEELGGLPKVRPAAQWTRAEDDHVVFTYLADLPEMFSPSADGETADETAGWGWYRRKAVKKLALHPAMAKTWKHLDFGDPLLGGDPPDGGTVAKADPSQGDKSVCPCGTPVVYDEMNGWQHADGSISHDDGESVSDKMKVARKSWPLHAAYREVAKAGGAAPKAPRSSGPDGTSTFPPPPTGDSG